MESATKRHKKHKNLAEFLLCLLCLFVAVPFGCGFPTLCLFLPNLTQPAVVA
jgi:hypothetical protein